MKMSPHGPPTLNSRPARAGLAASGAWHLLARFIGRDRAQAAATWSWHLMAPPAPGWSACQPRATSSAGCPRDQCRAGAPGHGCSHRAACEGCAPPLLANDEGERLTLHHGRYFQLVRYAGSSWDRRAADDP